MGTTMKRGRVAMGAVAVAAVGLCVLVASAAGAAGASSYRAQHARVGTTTTSTTAAPAAPVGPSASPTSDGFAPSFGPPTTFGADQQWLQTALADRVAQTGGLESKLVASMTLASGDRAVLTGLVTGAQSTLAALSGAVGSATTTLQLHAAAMQMIGLHVYAILTPQVKLVLRADTDSSAAASLRALEPDLGTAIAAAHAAKRKLAELHALIKRLTSAAGMTMTLAGPVAARVLSLAASDLPAAVPVLTTAGAELHRAEASLAWARQDLRSILSLLADPHLNAKSKRVLRR